VNAKRDVALLFGFLLIPGAGWLGNALRPPPAPPLPECWARVEHGVVIDMGTAGCLHKLPPRRPPVVRFNYAPLTPEQRLAYETNPPGVDKP